MAYVLLDDSNKVIQKQPNAQEGFVEAPEFVVCGWELRNDAWHKPEPSAEQIAAKETMRKQARLAYLDEAIPRWHTELEMDGVTVKPQLLLDWHTERKALRQELYGNE